MMIFSMQTVLLAGAGVALFLLWRAAMPSERWLQLTVAAGLLARAVAGTLLFWISWARLPVARSLQLGNGLWTFAQDALEYTNIANGAAAHGLNAILHADRTAPSVTWIQTLAAGAWLFGGVTSVAVVLNLFCYLAMVAILVRWGRSEPHARTAAAVVIVAVSLTPSLILWSLQPLKDTLFQFLFVAFIALCAWWQRSWTERGPAGRAWRSRAAIAVLMTAVLYMLAGIRWYVAFALLVGVTLFFVAAIVQSAERKAAAAATIVTVAVLTRAFVLSALPYLPPYLLAVLTPSITFAAARTAPSSLLTQVEQAREGFDRQAAATKIVGAPAPVAAPKLVRTPAVAPPVAPRWRTRLLSGLAAIVFPWRLGEWLGLFHIGGGHGMLWFTEIDTAIFDLALVLALLALAVRSAVPWRNPLTWLVLGVTLFLAAPLAYSISNYGTLFRLREMLYLGLLLIPLAVATSRRHDAMTPPRDA